MTSVKDFPPQSEWHAPLLMGLVFGQVQRTFGAEDWNGLRQSHLRVVSLVPPEGISITELGRRVGMTKQGCGQFVTRLVERGLLRTDADPADRRVRWVRRTVEGQQTLEAATARILEIEDDWAEVVGPDRYRTFRAVLEELALGTPPTTPLVEEARQRRLETR